MVLVQTKMGAASSAAPNSEHRIQAPWRSASNLALRLGVDAAALEVNADERLIADDPGIVSRRNDAHISRPELHLSSIIHLADHASRVNMDEMSNLATVGLSNGLDT